jgi:hypothetical protein
MYIGSYEGKNKWLKKINEELKGIEILLKKRFKIVKI